MKRVGLIFGGISNEAEISIASAKNIIANIDNTKQELKLIFWDKNGSFYAIKNISEIDKLLDDKKILPYEFSSHFDIALPMTHGKYGEDGVLQSILEWQKIKYCGCRVLSSALCMDKAIFKNFLRGHKINQTKFESIYFYKDDVKNKIAKIKKEFDLPIYVKPSNSGSSVGISKVSNFSKLGSAIKEARKHDSKIIIEEGLISPREIEVAVMGNNNLKISNPGELILTKEFYSYDDKYVLGQTSVVIPAKLNTKQIKEIKSLAEKAYHLGDCSGFARIDFFLSKSGKIYLNEINTLPGFTNISMFPMLMQKSGLTYKELISKIIDLAY